MIEYIKTHPSAEKIYRPDKKYVGGVTTDKL
jgi:hypothetical protein